MSEVSANNAVDDWLDYGDRLKKQFDNTPRWRWLKRHNLRSKMITVSRILWELEVSDGCK